MTRLFVVFAASFILFGCTARANRPPLVDGPTSDISGDWQGITRVLACQTQGSGRCEAVNRVRFSLIQSGAHIRGEYRCAYGNFECRHGGTDTDGYVQWGDIRGSEVRLDVLLPSDLSSCLYNGNVTAREIVGTYQCYEGGGIIEQGTWQMVRTGSDIGSVLQGR
jgi:hypothetical protein